MAREFKELEIFNKKFKVYEPTTNDLNKAREIRSRTVSQLMTGDNKLITMFELEEELKKRGIWDDKKQSKYDSLGKKIDTLRARLKSAKNTDGSKMTLKQGRDLAIKIKKIIAERRDMLVERSSMENNTVEGQAENQYFNYLISCCTYTVYDNGKEEPYFKSLEDYLARSNTPEAFICASTLSSMLYSGLNLEQQKSYTENTFLMNYNFMDDSLHLLNEKGQLVDEEGRLINEFGQLVNDKGELVDEKGNVLSNEWGTFVDEDGNEVVPKTEKNKETEEKIEADSPVDSAESSS